MVQLRVIYFSSIPWNKTTYTFSTISKKKFYSVDYNLITWIFFIASMTIPSCQETLFFFNFLQELCHIRLVNTHIFCYKTDCWVKTSLTFQPPPNTVSNSIWSWYVCIIKMDEGRHVRFVAACLLKVGYEALGQRVWILRRLWGQVYRMLLWAGVMVLIYLKRGDREFFMDWGILNESRCLTYASDVKVRFGEP